MVLFQFFGGYRGWSGWGGGGYFSNFVYWLDYWGVRDIILPFVLLFTIFFAMLQKIGLFGAGNKKYNLVISLAISLLVVIPHALGLYPPEADVINIINDSIPEVALLVVVVVLVLMLLGMVAGKEVKFAGVLPWVAGVSVIILLLIFANAIFPLPVLSYIDPAIQALLVILLVFGLLIYWFAGEPSPPGKAHAFWLGPVPESEYKEWMTGKKEGGGGG
ncbi:MAG: hypothetical protein QXM31_01115 [Candidatus Woesearchaeota archaeon]